ncbi:unnamed protein product [Triticum turgidum subsp. durum]|uniref:NAC domain-containing protein n=1 Tax=Triticum turgidum subsp. durum TaxID=4567 RepID=A0A9R1QAT7_TRITD|nr:unnamed protein product [Triticum turgidum subsp. durum]
MIGGSKLAEANFPSKNGSLKLDEWVLCRMYNKKNNWGKVKVEQDMAVEAWPGRSSTSATSWYPPLPLPSLPRLHVLDSHGSEGLRVVFVYLDCLLRAVRNWGRLFASFHPSPPLATNATTHSPILPTNKVYSSLKFTVS